VAVLLPEDVRAALADAAARLRAAAPDVAWVAPEHLHVTLKFLGQVDEARLSALAGALATAARGGPAFEARVVGLGAFPSAGRPRVLWAGVRDGAQALAALAARVEAACVGLGFAPETRPFAAHVTLGRVRSPRRAPRLADLLDAAAREELGRLRVERVTLMESRLSPHGARYLERASAPLA
jgi:2'-5' RNA ligase